VTIAAAGAATVLSFAILSEYFPKEMSGRANAALNLLHVASAFVLQSAAGLIIEQWPGADGIYPVDAHRTAVAVGLLLQLAALAWFALSTRRVPKPAMARVASRSLPTAHRPAILATPYQRAASVWAQHTAAVSTQAAGWRLAAATSVLLCLSLATTLYMTMSRPPITVHIFAAHASAYPALADGRSIRTEPMQGPAAFMLVRPGPAWGAPQLPSDDARAEPIVRPSPTALASSVRPHRR
jgi:MFS family permease